MKERLRIWPMKAVAALCLLAAVLPCAILIGRNTAPEQTALWWMPASLACLWGIAAYLLPPRGRIPFSCLGGVLLVAWAVLTQLPLGWTRMLIILPCLVILALLPPAWGKLIWEEWGAGFWIGSAVVHLAAQTLAATPVFSGTLAFLRPVFAGYLFLLLMALNRQSLRDGMHGGEKAPASLRRRNTILISVMFLFALAAACWGILAEWLAALWMQIKRGLVWLIGVIGSLLPENQGGGTGGGGGDMLSMLGGAEEKEPGLFAVILEKAAMAVAGVLLLGLIILAGRVLFRGIVRLWKKLTSFFRRYAEDADADYIDETESTLNWEEKTQSLRKQILQAVRRPEKAPRWESLDGRGRVRQLYRQFLMKRPQEKIKTAREALREDPGLTKAQADDFARLYERARYSNLEITENEADALRSTIKASR